MMFFKKFLVFIFVLYSSLGSVTASGKYSASQITIENNSTDLIVAIDDKILLFGSSVSSNDSCTMCVLDPSEISGKFYFRIGRYSSGVLSNIIWEEHSHCFSVPLDGVVLADPLLVAFEDTQSNDDRWILKYHIQQFHGNYQPSGESTLCLPGWSMAQAQKK